MKDAPLAAEDLTLNAPEAAAFPPPIPQLTSGEIPAILVPPITEQLMADPRVESLLLLFPQMKELGLDYYEAQSAETVIYNPDLISESDLVEAEQNGTLAQLAMPIMEPEEAMGEAPMAGPLAGAGASSGASARLADDRVQNMEPPRVSPIQPNPLGDQLGRRAM
jgi:hypothetical protein